MSVQILAMAHLRHQMPGGRAEATQEIAAGETVADAIRRLGLKRADVGAVRLNGQHATPASLLHEGDLLELFPLIGGG
jgi:sulfur carrier protein ThiS